MSYLVEGLFRRPRLWSNKELLKFSHLFTGRVINVSGAQDSSKSISNPFKYFFTPDYDSGRSYKDYFINANEYQISNFKEDRHRGHGNTEKDSTVRIDLDLNESIPDCYIESYDVVFNHTVLEHVFDIFTAFKNLCLLSSDLVIIVVPFVQRVHDYNTAYSDYWRLTPFAIDELFKRNGMEVIYRSSNSQISASIYYFYIASKKPEKWRHLPEFSNLTPTHRLNLGANIFVLSRIQSRIEAYVRKISWKALKLFQR